jgi:hypothetical protein
VRTLVIAILTAIIVALVFDRSASPPQSARERVSTSPMASPASARGFAAKAAPASFPDSVPPPTPDPRASLAGAIDRRIKSILAPLPDVNYGPFGSSTTASDIAAIRQNILQHYQSTGTGHPAALQSAHQLCDFLISAATERDAFVQRLNNTLASTETRLAQGPTTWYSEKRNERLRRQERDGRVTFFQSTIQQEWTIRSGQLQVLAEARYAAFRATLADRNLSN